MLKHRLAVLLTPLLIVGMVACSDENPTTSEKNNGSGPDVTAPDAVSDLVTASPTLTTISVVWTAPGDDGNSGTASEYDLRYSTSQITEQDWGAAIHVDGEPAPKPAGDLETVRVENLESGKKYYFAVKTSDEVPNVSALSNVASDSTEQETIAPEAVSDLSAESIDDGMFRVTWTAPGDDGTVGNASTYDIRCSTSRITDANWDSADQVGGEGTPNPPGTPDTMVVSGLQSGTDYFFAMKTGDEVPNWSEISNLCPALAHGNDLWAFPDRVVQGNNLTIVYRTPDTGMSKLHAHYRNEVDQWARLVIEWNWPPGTHVMEWDFKRGGDYHSNPLNFYTLKLYWGVDVVAEKLVQLVP